MKTVQIFVVITLIILLSSIVSAQDIIYTLAGEIEGERTSIDSIAVENLTNGTFLGFGNLTERNDYRINLTQKSFWGSTSSPIIVKDRGFLITRNQPGSLEIRSINNIENKSHLMIYNINGQKVASTSDFETGKTSSFLVEIGTPGIYIVSITTPYQTQIFRVIGNTGRGNISITTIAGRDNSSHYKSRTNSNNDDFFFNQGDSLQISVFKDGFIAESQLLQITSNDSFLFSFLACYAPEVFTYDADEITTKAATLHGKVVWNGRSNIFEQGFFWSQTNPSPDNNDNKIEVIDTSNILSAELNGLSDNTIYHFVAYAVNRIGITYGEKSSFTTLSIVLPTVTTDSITDITQTSATIENIITNDGGAPVTERGVCWNTNGNPDLDDNKTSDGTGTGSFTSNITGLEANTSYYVRAYATNSMGTSYGDQVILKSSPNIPTVSTGSITNITQTTANGGGNVISDGGAPVIKRGICRSSWSDPTIQNSTTSDGTGIGIYTSKLSGLNRNTTYHVRAYATNSQGTAYGEQIIFKTQDISVPTVSTNSITDISQNSAKGGGEITSDGGSELTSYGVCRSTSPEPTTTIIKIYNLQSTSSFSSYLTGLTPNTTYYARAYASNIKGISYGAQIKFTTLKAVLPNVSTVSISEIGQNKATGGGNVIFDGGEDLKSRGICWSTSKNPTIVNNTTSDGTGKGSFSSSITGLTSNTTYYVRAYATNNVGTAYGNEVSFKTIQELTVTTASISNKAQTKATGGGNVISDGGENVSERGICWSKSSKPTIADYKIIIGSGTGSFIYNFTRLAPNTTYFVRAYATNKDSMAYGNEVSFTTNEDKEGDYLTDSRDGQSYKTVKIGTQTWMAENLAYLPVISDADRGSTTEKLYYVFGYWGSKTDVAKLTNNYTTYGTLYNWPAAMDGCPTGWHLPSQDEWIALENYLADNGYNYDGTIGGGNRKIAKAIAGQTNWLSSTNTGAIGNNLSKNNRSGFSALPGGYSASSMYAQIGITGEWWTSNDYDTLNAYYFEMWHNFEFVSFDKDLKRFGSSVRCLKD